jgi:hypothetical protein
MKQWIFPTSSATSHTVSRQFAHNIFYLGNQRFRSWNWMPTRPLTIFHLKLFHFWDIWTILTWLTRGIITVCFTQHVVSFCSCFPHFETEFNKNYLRVYRLHTEWKKASTHLITKPVIETKYNIQSTWNRMACITDSQFAWSFKQPLTWPMHCCSSPSFRELSEHTLYMLYYIKYKMPSNLRCTEFLNVGSREKTRKMHIPQI